MKCKHCGIAFHENWIPILVMRAQALTEWSYRTADCPECRELTIELARRQNTNPYIPPDNDFFTVYPRTSNRGPVPKSVPEKIRQDYIEAVSVLELSPKASAALARRCLQAVLNEQSYVGRDLSKQIDSLLNEQDARKATPSTLRSIIDAVRNFGNFSAHPINDLTTLQIIDVDPGEAEWCLDILDECFDHFYVRPALARERKAALDKKLTDAGKPVSK